ncbi:MAG: riboflavin synthase [Alphaproteobacteria bacterium]|nr:riboflavin synthase [Alphaproteobacteria bacterium]
MFTGLVTDLGRILAMERLSKGVTLRIRTAYALDEIELGASIAVNGVCLTAESFGADWFTATAGQETLAVTTLGGLQVGDRVHLEQAMRVGDRLGGHMVQGHVDGVGELVSIHQDAESWILLIRPPEALSRYIVKKGSICVDGVSLTVNEWQGEAFRLNIIPHTAEHTNLARLSPGAPVNLEVDIIARYVERLLGARETSGLDLQRLRALGY